MRHKLRGDNAAKAAEDELADLAQRATELKEQLAFVRLPKAKQAWAQTRCDKSRRKSNLPHVYWSVGDRPCTDCISKARKTK